MKMKDWEDRRMSFVISFFSSFSASHFKRQDMKNLEQWIFKILMGWTWISAASKTYETRAVLSSVVVSIFSLTIEWKLIFFYLLQLHFSLLLMFGNFPSLVLTLSLALHICRGGLGNKSGIKSLCWNKKQPVDGFQDTFPTRDQWTTKPVVSFTYQDGDNS